MTYLNALCAIFAAAVFWVKSSISVVKASDMPKGGTGNPEIKANDTLLVSTLLLQAKWNKWAAIMAACAALFQSASVLSGAA